MIGENLKILRRRREISQEEMAGELGLTRSSYSGYENGVAEPSIETLARFSDFVGVPLDIIARRNLAKFTEKDWSKLGNLIPADLDGSRLRILATTVNSENEENIELVSHKARAGYVTGYADPEFISVLPTFQLPFLRKDRKYRTFPISGDSMPPVTDGSFVVGEFVENWNNVKDGFPYIVVTPDDGIVFKIVYNRLADTRGFQLCSTNPAYEPFEVPATSVVEIWKFVNYICPDMPTTGFNESELTKAVLGLQADVKHLKNVYIPKGK